MADAVRQGCEQSLMAWEHCCQAWLARVDAAEAAKDTEQQMYQEKMREVRYHIGLMVKPEQLDCCGDVFASLR